MTPKIIEFKTVNGYWYWMQTPKDKHSLDDEVAKAMQEGWTPLGGPVLVIPAKRRTSPILAQTMVKYANKRVIRP